VKRRLLPILFALLVVPFTTLWVVLPLGNAFHPDFRINFLGAFVFRAGESAYDDAAMKKYAPLVYGPGTQLSQDDDFNHPPFSALLIAPLVPLGSERAFLLYYVANVAGFAAAIWIGARLGGGDRRSWAWAAALAAFAWPIAVSLALGQVDGLITVLVGLGGWALARRSRGAALAGFPIGLAAGVKLIPALFLAYFVVARRRDALAWAVAGCGLTLFLPVAIFGWETTLPRFLAELPSTAGPSPHFQNVSLPALLSRVYTGRPGLYQLLPVPLPTPVRLASTALSVAVAAFGVWRARSQPAPRACLIVIAAGLLASPRAWDHYLAWLLPFLAPALAETGRQPWNRWSLHLGAALTFLTPLHPLLWTREVPWYLDWIPIWQIGLVLIVIASAHLPQVTGQRDLASRPVEASTGGYHGADLTLSRDQS
jgi:alpha-1,2-mannosyltransferase